MKFAIKSDVGAVRNENQDQAIYLENDGISLALICDGMGGHSGGLMASTITTRAFEKYFTKKKPKFDTVRQWLEEAINNAKKFMTKAADGNQDLMDMGTTVAGAIIFKDKVFIFNVGDSRVYAYNGLLHQITRDQNLRNYYIDQFGYSEEQASSIMGADALTSALGPLKITNVEVSILPLSKDVKYLILTTDGVHHYISKPMFEKILANKNEIDLKVDEMINMALKGRSTDNLTAIIVDMEC